jgi:hypothetical protein
MLLMTAASYVSPLRSLPALPALPFIIENSSTKDAMTSQAAHDTYGFKFSGIGKHERREGRWHLLPLWKGFESNDNEHVWQELDDVFAGIPVLVKRYLRKLLKSKTPEEVRDGTEVERQRARLAGARRRLRGHTRAGQALPPQAAQVQNARGGQGTAPTRKINSNTSNWYRKN